MSQTRPLFQIVVAGPMGTFAQVAGVGYPCEGSSNGSAIVSSHSATLAWYTGKAAFPQTSLWEDRFDFWIESPFPNQPLAIGCAQKGWLFARDQVTLARVWVDILTGHSAEHLLRNECPWDPRVPGKLFRAHTFYKVQLLFSLKKKSQTHPTVDISLTNDRRPLNFILTGYVMQAGSQALVNTPPQPLPRLEGRSCIFFSGCEGKKINWFWNIHTHFSMGTLIITHFDRRAEIPKLLPLHDTSGLLFCLADPNFFFK